MSDYLTKKQKPNRGELPQYHVKRSHPAIISKDVFDYVQEEIKRRGLLEKPYKTIHVLSSK
ncbi:MAG: recombinase family protein [Bacillota bacterium]